MNPESLSFPFPFTADAGRVNGTGGDEAIRGKIVQVLFTAPGERVNKPDFGCGLFNLVFEPNDLVRAAAVEFSVGQALTRWLAADVIVEAVNVKPAEEKVLVEVVYTRKRDLARQAVRIHFR